MVRACVLTTILGLALSSAAFGQVTAGCGEIGICGTANGTTGSGTNGSGTGSTGAVNGFYLQNAQQWNLKAAQCQNPVGAACARSYATWANCMAYNSNNNSCGNRPVCVASCSTSGTGGVVPSFSSGGTRAAQVNNLIGAGFQLFSLFHKDSPAPEPENNDDDDPGPDPAEAAAAQQQFLNAQAANLLASANSLLPTLTGAAPGTPAQPDSNAAVSALLDDGSASNSSTAAINALLGDTSQPGAGNSTVASAVNNLLSDSDTPPASVNVPQTLSAPQPGDPFYQPPAIDKGYGAGLTFPVQDQEIEVDLSDSTDQPNPSMLATLKQGVSDELNQLVDQGKQLIAPYVNDPGIQAVYHIVSNGGTMPVTQATDSADTMVNDVAGSALLTSVPILKATSTTPVQMLTNPVGTYKNMAAPANQMNDQTVGILGFAQSNFPMLNPVGEQ